MAHGRRASWSELFGNAILTHGDHVVSASFSTAARPQTDTYTGTRACAR